MSRNREECTDENPCSDCRFQEELDREAAPESDEGDGNTGTRTRIKRGRSKWFVIDIFDDILLATADSESEAVTYQNKYESPDMDDETYSEYVDRAAARLW
jgi:hypothetical protein